MDVIAVVHRVGQPRAAAAFLERVLGMTRTEDADDECRVTSGALELRLLPLDEGGASTVLELELATNDALEGRERLLAEPGARLRSDAHRTRADRIELEMEMPFAVVVRVVQHLDEDQLGLLPPLPASLEWASDATRLVQETLRTVPLAFRDQARRRMTERAEFLAVRDGRVLVQPTDAVRGMIEATPDFQQPALRATLATAGVLSPGEST